MTDGELLAAARRQRVVPLFYERDADRARRAVAALAAGGARLVEYTLRGDGAEQVLAELVGSAPPGVAVGAGSVSDERLARAALAAGAAFVVGPNAAARVAAACREAAIAYVPGCLTPTEVVAAGSWGCPLVKVFPVAALGGADYVRALRGPLPTLQVMATGGVRLEEVEAYLTAGCVCVGIGSELIRPTWVRDGDEGRLEETMRDAIGRARGGMP